MPIGRRGNSRVCRSSSKLGGRRHPSAKKIAASKSQIGFGDKAMSTLKALRGISNRRRELDSNGETFVGRGKVRQRAKRQDAGALRGRILDPARQHIHLLAGRLWRIRKVYVQIRQCAGGALRPGQSIRSGLRLHSAATLHTRTGTHPCVPDSPSRLGGVFRARTTVRPSGPNIAQVLGCVETTCEHFRRSFRACQLERRVPRESIALSRSSA